MWGLLFVLMNKSYHIVEDQVVNIPLVSDLPYYQVLFALFFGLIYVI